MKITKMHLTGPNKAKKELESLEFYAYHYTANPKPTAGALNHFGYANRPGFKAADGKLYQDSSAQSSFVYGAAHHYIDSTGIFEFIPVTMNAPHVGAKKYTDFIKKAIPAVGKGASPNAYIVGAEVCINPESDIYQALEYMAWDAAKVLREAKKTPDRFIRHFDVTGKWCPAMSIDEKTWIEAKQDLRDLYRIDVTWIPYIPFENVKDRVEYYFSHPTAEPVLSKDSPLRVGEKKAWVKPEVKLMTPFEIQKMLNQLGMTDDAGRKLTVDGDLGAKSKQAIKKLEKAVGVKVDGVFDITLQTAAEKLLKKK